MQFVYLLEWALCVWVLTDTCFLNYTRHLVVSRWRSQHQCQLFGSSNMFMVEYEYLNNTQWRMIKLSLLLLSFLSIKKSSFNIIYSFQGTPYPIPERSNYPYSHLRDREKLDQHVESRLIYQLHIMSSHTQINLRCKNPIKFNKKEF